MPLSLCWNLSSHLAHREKESMVKYFVPLFICDGRVQSSREELAEDIEELKKKVSGAVEEA